MWNLLITLQEGEDLLQQSRQNTFILHRFWILNDKCYSQVEIKVDDAGAVLTNLIYEP